MVAGGRTRGARGAAGKKDADPKGRRRSSGGSRAKKDSVKVDLSGTESRVLLPPGEYDVVVENISIEKGSTSKENYLKWLFRTKDVSEDRFDKQPLYFNTSLQPQALWNLRSLLETLDVEIPDKVFDLKFEDLLGLDMIAIVEHETYENRPRAHVVDFMPIDDGKEQVEVEDGVTDGDLEKLTEAEVSDLTEDELEDVVKDYDLDVDLSKLKRRMKKISAVCDALESAGHLEG